MKRGRQFLLFLRKGLFRLSFLPLLLLYLSGCGQEAREGDVFETITQGINSGIHTQTMTSVRSQTSWNNFWAAHAGADSEVPPVDFNTEMVIVVHLGTRPSRNDGVNITAVENQTPEVLVRYTEVVARSGCITRGQESQPHHIIKLPKNGAPIKFLRTEQEHNCI